MMTLPELKITVYSDYICPFCYVGHHRLQRLRDSYDLKINWCFLEIHPETSAKGEPIDSLDYPSEQWQQMLQSGTYRKRRRHTSFQAKLHHQL